VADLKRENLSSCLGVNNMRVSIIATMVLISWGCKPGVVGQVTRDKNSETIELEPQPGSQAIPSNQDAMPLPPDPEEESKAVEPGIIGGAYLYCDAGEAKGKEAAKVQVGCRTVTVNDNAWASADKSVQFYDFTSGTSLSREMTSPAAGDPYQMYFSEESSQLMAREILLNINLPMPQGRLEMTSTVTPYHSGLALLRINPGLTLLSSTDGVVANKDRKTWNEWMPLKIPASLVKLPVSSGKEPRAPRGADAVATVELRFDDTVCTYIQGKEPKEEMLLNFVSCSREVWKPEMWVRVKAVSLGVLLKAGANEAGDYAVTLQTEP